LFVSSRPKSLLAIDLGRVGGAKIVPNKKKSFGMVFAVEKKYIFMVDKLKIYVYNVDITNNTY
jgi:hypothetical protein